MAFKIGIDFHGVICARPELFAIFCSAIRKQGIAVYIISGGPKKDIIPYLEEQGIAYDKVWTIVDFYEQKGLAAFYEDGSFEIPTELWDRAKAEYCQKENIAFHIDDSGIYGQYFVTPYCKYDICSGVCELKNGAKVDFSRPEAAAAQIAELLKNTTTAPTSDKTTQPLA